MRSALYKLLFVEAQKSTLQIKKARKKKYVEKMQRIIFYSAIIAAFAISTDKPGIYVGVAAGFCFIFEWLR